MKDLFLGVPFRGFPLPPNFFLRHKLQILIIIKVKRLHTYCIILEEYMTPLILHIEEEGEDDADEGAGDADDHYQASVHHGRKVWAV